MFGNNTFFWEGIRDLGFYNKEFEETLLIKTSEEYEIKSLKWIGECTAPEYLQLADAAFTHEEGICSQLLQLESKQKLMSRVEKELISSRKQ